MNVWGNVDRVKERIDGVCECVRMFMHLCEQEGFVMGTCDVYLCTFLCTYIHRTFERIDNKNNTNQITGISWPHQKLYEFHTVHRYLGLYGFSYNGAMGICATIFL